MESSLNKMNDTTDEDELDPRIQVELEQLNTTTDEINRLEIEYDVSYQIFYVFRVYSSLS